MKIQKFKSSPKGGDRNNIGNDMAYFIIWIFIAALCGSIGSDRECGAFYGFGWGLLCPPIGLIYVALSKKKKSIAEALQEAEIFFRNGVINQTSFEKMRADILNGKIKDVKHYKKSLEIKPF